MFLFIHIYIYIYIYIFVCFKGFIYKSHMLMGFVLDLIFLNHFAIILAKVPMCVLCFGVSGVNN